MTKTGAAKPKGSTQPDTGAARAKVLPADTSTGALVPHVPLALQTTAVDRERWAVDILDKQYRMYSLADAKILNLITVNGLLLAAVGFVFDREVSDRLSIISSVLATAFIALSLFACVIHSVLKLRSGKASTNPRSLVGMQSYVDADRYVDHFNTITIEDNLNNVLRQAYGMAKNNMKSVWMARASVVLT